MKLQVGVKIFLKNKDGKYLILRRNSEKYKDVKKKWDIVGGRIDPGVSLMDNLAREVLEETQLKITSTPKLICAQDIIQNEEKHVVRLSYTGETDGEPILDTTENVDYKWLTLDEIKKQEDLDVYVLDIMNRKLIG